MTSKIDEIENITIREILIQLGIGAALGTALVIACFIGGWLNHFFC